MPTEDDVVELKKRRDVLKKEVLSAYRKQITQNVDELGMDRETAEAEAIMLLTGSQILMVIQAVMKANPEVEPHGLAAFTQMVAYARGLMAEDFYTKIG